MGDYTSFNLKKCIKDKMGTMVLDEGGLYSPLSVSLIIPTRFGSEEKGDVEREALKRILSECSELVDSGYLDEIVVIDATKYENGKPDFRVLQNVITEAYDGLGLFKEQVNLLNKYGSQNQKAKRGLTDFFIKVVHQFDDNISRVLAKFGVFGVMNIWGIPYGKGAGLWLSIPITSGDILCFIDSDILNFKKEFVTALCHPIVYSWNLREAAIKSVKAYYTRLTKTPNLSPNETILGGRVCRLFAIPLIKAITKSCDMYNPLAMIKYPLAGEFSLSRDTIEKLGFPLKYSVEVYLLLQLFDLVGCSSMAQVDLKVFRHIGQKFQEVKILGYEIGACILEKIIEMRKNPITDVEKERILRSYQKKEKQVIGEAKELISRFQNTEEMEENEKLVYSIKEEKERFQVFLKLIKNILDEKLEQKNIILPSWNQVKDKTGDYFDLREMLRRRSNQSTWSRLKECGLLKRPF